MYAIIETGNKQFIVRKNDVLRIEKLEEEIGKEIEFDKVLLLQDDNGNVEVGKPYLSNVKVIGEVQKQDRAKKIIVFKKKRRKGYKKTIGHRQYFTAVKIKDIKTK